MPHGAVEIWSKKMGAFKVNGQRLKPYLVGDIIEKQTTQLFVEPDYCQSENS